MASVDFWIEISSIGALIHCETDIARSAAFELSRDDTVRARVSHSGTGDLVLRTSVDDLEDVVDHLRYAGFEVLDVEL